MEHASWEHLNVTTRGIQAPCRPVCFRGGFRLQSKLARGSASRVNAPRCRLNAFLLLLSYYPPVFGPKARKFLIFGLSFFGLYIANHLIFSASAHF
jgi:hypothetical protein